MRWRHAIDDDPIEVGRVGGRSALILAAVLALALSACAGEGGAVSVDDGSGVNDDSSAAGQDNSGGDEETSPDAGDGNYAIVTVGDTTYEVPPDPLNTCNSLDNLVFGSFAVDANGEVTQAGGTDVAVQVNFGIPAADWQDQGLQPPTLDVDVRDDGIRWWASTDRGYGSVDSWELDGGKAVGQASFTGEEVGSGNEAGAESGSFEIVCRQQ